MDAYDRIYDELAPFFQYATADNPSKIFETFKTPNQKDQTYRIYERCVICNGENFNLDSLPKLKVGDNTYFCHSCKDEIRKVVLKYDAGQRTEEGRIFYEVYQKYLFEK